MKILILGSEGQIGKFLLDKLENEGHQVRKFDIKLNKKMDLRISKNLFFENSMDECDFVFFLAFDVGGSSYLEKHQDSFNFISNNIRIMENVFSALKLKNKKFIFASSVMAFLNDSTYGELKRIGESYTKALNGISVRLWNIYGLEDDKARFHIISDLISRAINEKRIYLKTDGTETRQFLHGRDCADGFYQIFLNYDTLNESIYHLSSFSWTKISTIAEIIAELAAIKKIEFSELKDEVHRAIQFDPNEKVLSFWKPKIPLKIGIEEIYQTMLKIHHE